jgi:DivIVA domain-containing protein
VELDRHSVARRDFPTARRGYDPGAVDRHLAAIADEVDALSRRAAAGPGAALATQTSEQVRAVIEAAERSASDIRDAAAADAREHVARVAEAADGLRERIDALDREITEILGALRAGAERLRRELDDVAAGTAGLRAAGGPREAPAAVAPDVLGATLGATAAAADEEVGEEPALAAVEEAREPPAAPVPVEEAPATAAGPAPVPEAPPTAAPAPAPPPPGRRDDVAGAKFVALQWAIDGRPREETDRYLAENYDLPDRAALLDEVYALARQD